MNILINYMLKNYHRYFNFILSISSKPSEKFFKRWRGFFLSSHQFSKKFNSVSIFGLNFGSKYLLHCLFIFHKNEGKGISRNCVASHHNISKSYILNPIIVEKLQKTFLVKILIQIRYKQIETIVFFSPIQLSLFYRFFFIFFIFFLMNSFLGFLHLLFRDD